MQIIVIPVLPRIGEKVCQRLLSALGGQIQSIISKEPFAALGILKSRCRDIELLASRDIRKCMGIHPRRESSRVQIGNLAESLPDIDPQKVFFLR